MRSVCHKVTTKQYLQYTHAQPSKSYARLKSTHRHLQTEATYAWLIKIFGSFVFDSFIILVALFSLLLISVLPYSVKKVNKLVNSILETSSPKRTKKKVIEMG